MTITVKRTSVSRDAEGFRAERVSYTGGSVTNRHF